MAFWGNWRQHLGWVADRRSIDDVLDIRIEEGFHNGFVFAHHRFQVRCDYV
ncbi:MAG TPA: hypothetical protein VNY30_01300 [Bryobacteraceae bacterium]|nr:hypothetical protein [Bryobacteraceae bacterium]